MNESIVIKHNWQIAKRMMKSVAYTIVVFCALLSLLLYVKMHNEIMGGYTALRLKLIDDLTHVVDEKVDSKIGTIIQQAGDRLRLKFIEERKDEPEK